MAAVNLINQIGTIFGQQFYRFYCRKFSFKQILAVSTVLYSLNSALKLLITENIVQKWIPVDIFTYVTSWLYTFINEIHLMPIMVLACDMCPKSVEATFYSFILALINLAYLISYDAGGLLSSSLHITNTNFDNISVLISIASIYPLLSLPLLFCLVPSQQEMNHSI